MTTPLAARLAILALVVVAGLWLRGARELTPSHENPQVGELTRALARTGELEHRVFVPPTSPSAGNRMTAAVAKGFPVRPSRAGQAAVVLGAVESDMRFFGQTVMVEGCDPPGHFDSTGHLLGQEFAVGCDDFRPNLQTACNLLVRDQRSD